jgi:hypothetical protein
VSDQRGEVHQRRYLIAVLEQLTGFYAGQRVVLGWDGLSEIRLWWLRSHPMHEPSPVLRQ